MYNILIITKSVDRPSEGMRITGTNTIKKKTSQTANTQPPMGKMSVRLSCTVPRWPKNVKSDSGQAVISMSSLHIGQGISRSSIWRDGDLTRGRQRFRGLIPRERGRIIRIIEPHGCYGCSRWGRRNSPIVCQWLPHFAHVRLLLLLLLGRIECDGRIGRPRTPSS